MTQNIKYLVALGGNIPSALGDPTATLRAALSMLHCELDISISAVSSFRQTRAFPPGSGPDYANGVAILHSGLPPPAMLARLHLIEARFGRQRQGARWQARPLDLDLIAAEDLILPDPATQSHWRNLPPAEQPKSAPMQLILPHPRMQDRDFVLDPLAEIAPGWRHPLIGLTVQEMLAALAATA